MFGLCLEYHLLLESWLCVNISKPVVTHPTDAKI